MITVSNAGNPALKPETTVYTIGYEGVTIEMFLRRLTAAGIKQLIDVRRNPLSCKPGFSKKVLAMYLNEIEVEYIFICLNWAYLRLCGVSYTATG
ncbi:MAG: DUF488 domain-containing protein [Planctomycetaceae bacterium]|jgi:uncharacterized protein (DUF488 family)|nr:DUF488 domain-containing protein [Planctomycetaceae bacterium]